MHNTLLYFHYNPIKQEVFYVGIGSKDRAFSKQSRNRHWKYTVAKYGYEVQIIKENLSRDQACVLERFWIKTFGRKDLKQGSLVNYTEGGDGIFEGHTHNEIAKANIAKGNKGKNKGRIHTKEARSRMGGNRGDAWNKGMKMYWINNTIIEKQITEDQFINYINDGWTKGRRYKKMKN